MQIFWWSDGGSVCLPPVCDLYYCAGMACVQNKHGCNAIDEQSSNAFSSSLSLFVVTIYFQVIDLQYLVATYILDPSKQQLTYFLFY